MTWRNTTKYLRSGHSKREKTHRWHKEISSKWMKDMSALATNRRQKNEIPSCNVDSPRSGSIWHNRQNAPLFLMVAHTTANTSNAKNFDHVMFGFPFQGWSWPVSASFCWRGFTSTFLSSTFLGLPPLSSVKNWEWIVKQIPEIKPSALKF